MRRKGNHCQILIWGLCQSACTLLYEAYFNIKKHVHILINASLRKHHDLGFNKCSSDLESKSLTK